VFRQRDPATAFFVVINGWIKLYRITFSGEETVVNVLTRGGSYAEAHALTGACYPATAEAVSGARVVHVPADHVIRCIRESPDIGLAMIAAASLHFHDLVQQIEQFKGQSGVQRVAEFLASLVPVDSGSCVIALPYDKALIAATAGPQARVAFTYIRQVAVGRGRGAGLACGGKRCRQAAPDRRG
jgi:CRP-like cAMP-binding protein